MSLSPSQSALIYSDAVLGYDFGPQHPLQPVRYKLTYDLMRVYGLFDSGITLLPPESSTDAQLEAVHVPEYIRTVRALSEAPEVTVPQAGFGRGDNPTFAGMHEVSALVAGGSIQAARKVMDGELSFAFNIAGGLHHALPARASGFCVYNDPAVAIAWLLNQGVNRIAYIDTDAHHGDGVQWIFYEDPRVMTISIHESGRYLFPGTGHVDEIGSGPGRGVSINIPLEPDASDADVLLALDEAVLPLTREFNPDILVLQHGADMHHLDPLTHLQCTLAVYPRIGERERALAAEVCDGKAISGGGGGYAYREIVPRAWTATFAAMAGVPISEELPEEWREGAGVLATTLTEDRSPPVSALTSTRQTITNLMRELGKRPL